MAASGLLRAVLHVAGAAVPWLATILLHSTVLLCAAWALDALLRERAPRVRATAWRTALVGGVVTATLASLAGGGAQGPSVRPQWTLSTGQAPAPHPIVPVPVPVAPEEGGGLVEPWPIGQPAERERAGVDGATRRHTHGLTIEPGKRGAAGAGPARAVAAPAPAFGLRDLPAAGVLVAFLVALGLGVRQMRAQRRLAWVLAFRTPASAGALHAALARAAPRAAGRVRLSTLEGLPTPVAFGMRRPEICVPPRALTDLDARALHALLAHEAAHLDARDPLWTRVSVWLASVLWIQPLHRVAARRLEEISEALADAAAVASGGGPEALASCLVEVAGWAVEGRETLPLPAMARPGPDLVCRVERLLSGAVRPERDRLRSRAVRVAIASACVAGAFLWGPVVRGDASAPSGATSVDGHVVVSSNARCPPPVPQPSLDPLAIAVLEAELAELQSELATLGRTATAHPQVPRDLLTRLRDREARLADRARAVREAIRPPPPPSSR